MSRESPQRRDIRADLQLEAELLNHHLRFRSCWGLFSPREIDAGTRLLLDHLDVAADEVALDVGCGYGPIGLAVAAAAPQGEVHLIDKDFVAIDYAQRNAALNGLDARTSIYLSNMLGAVPADKRFSLVLSNLPAKSGNELYTILLEDAYQRMQPGARIVIVTINGLRQFVKRSFTSVFGNYDKLKQGSAYTVSMAIKER